jgi:hypothetical protein
MVIPIRTGPGPVRPHPIRDSPRMSRFSVLNKHQVNLIGQSVTLSFFKNFVVWVPSAKKNASPKAKFWVMRVSLWVMWRNVRTAARALLLLFQYLIQDKIDNYETTYLTYTLYMFSPWYGVLAIFVYTTVSLFVFLLADWETKEYFHLTYSDVYWRMYTCTFTSSTPECALSRVARNYKHTVTKHTRTNHETFNHRD